MVVALQVCIKAGSFPAGTKGCYQAKIIEQPKCPVNGVKRYRWQPPPDTPVNLLGIRVIFGLRNFAKNLQALMRHLNPFITTHRFE